MAVYFAFNNGALNLAQAEALSIASAEDQSRVLRQIENGWCKAAEQIKDQIIGRKPSLDLAIFDTGLYSGGYISDLLAEEENTFFADVEQFDRLQREAIENLIRQYEETHDFAEFEEGYFNRYQYRDVKEGEQGGVVIVLHYSGEVEIHEGLAKPEIDASNVAALKTKTKATYSKPLVEYMGRQKSIAVQSVLLENPRVMKEITVSAQLAGFRYQWSAHSHLSYFDSGESAPPALAHINAVAKEVYTIFAEPPEDFAWHCFSGLFTSHEEAYDALKDLSDEKIEMVLMFLQALKFGQSFPDRLDTDADKGVRIFHFLFYCFFSFIIVAGRDISASHRQGVGKLNYCS